MIAARAALAGAAMLLAFVLGWIFTPAPATLATATGALRLTALRLDPPGASAAAAAAELARLHGASAPPAAPRIAIASPATFIAPPPPQPDAVLRSELTAVEGREGDLRLVLVGARSLKTGDAYMGWRLAALSRTSAVLSRGGERRTVDFFAPTPASPGVAMPARLASPGVEGSRPSPTAAEFFSGFKG